MDSESKRFALREYDSCSLTKAQLDDAEPTISGEFLLVQEVETEDLILIHLKFHSDPVSVRAVNVPVVEYDSGNTIHITVLVRFFGVVNMQMPIYEMWNCPAEDSDDDTAFDRWIRKI